MPQAAAPFLDSTKGACPGMGLGALHSVPLAMDCRKTLVIGGDPIAERKGAGSAVPTFGAFADRFLETKGPGWRNEKHRAQWKMTLEVYAAPLRRKPVDAIATEDILTVLKPIWNEKAETASRLRGRIEQVLDAARAASHRSGENPAHWKGHLDQLLPKRQKLTRGHHAVMPYIEVPAFVQALRERPAVASLALEFAILTAARSGEVLGARWAEIDADEMVWTVPKERMKGKREHRIPLSSFADAVANGSNRPFPGGRRRWAELPD